MPNYPLIELIIIKKIIVKNTKMPHDINFKF